MVRGPGHGCRSWRSGRSARGSSRCARRSPPPPKAPLKLAVQLWKRWRDVAFSSPRGDSAALDRAHDDRRTSVPQGAARHGRAGRHPGGDARCLVASGCQRFDEPGEPARDRSRERWLAAPMARYDAFREELASFAAAWRTLVQQGTFLMPSAQELMRLFGEMPVEARAQGLRRDIHQGREDGHLLRALTKTRHARHRRRGRGGCRCQAHTFFGGPRGQVITFKRAGHGVHPCRLFRAFRRHQRSRRPTGGAGLRRRCGLRAAPYTGCASSTGGADYPRSMSCRQSSCRASAGGSLPHVYPENQPCLYLPRSGEWDARRSLAQTIIPLGD